MSNPPEEPKPESETRGMCINCHDYLNRKKWDPNLRKCKDCGQSFDTYTGCITCGITTNTCSSCKAPLISMGGD